MALLDEVKAWLLWLLAAFTPVNSLLRLALLSEELVEEPLELLAGALLFELILVELTVIVLVL